MAIKDVIALLDAEIAALKEARQLLKADSTGSAAPRKAGRPRKADNALPTVVAKTKKTKKKRNLSPEGRARIASRGQLTKRKRRGCASGRAKKRHPYYTGASFLLRLSPLIGLADRSVPDALD